MRGLMAVVVVGVLLGGLAAWHQAVGGAGAGGRPFVIVLALGVAAAFLLEEWTD